MGLGVVIRKGVFFSRVGITGDSTVIWELGIGYRYSEGSRGCPVPVRVRLAGRNYLRAFTRSFSFLAPPKWGGTAGRPFAALSSLIRPGREGRDVIKPFRLRR
jgi:hypothetical protein